MRVRFFAGALALLLAGQAAAADLDRPMSTRPTIRSEIGRGFDASRSCMMVRSAPRYGLCVDDIDQRNTAAAVGDRRPFQLGLWFGGWLNATIMAEAFHDDAMTGEAAAELATFRSIQAGLKITNAQLVDLVEANHAEVKSRLDDWIAHPRSR